jgi:hypothetical protein
VRNRNIFGGVGRPDPNPHGQPGRPLPLAAFSRCRFGTCPVGGGWHCGWQRARTTSVHPYEDPRIVTAVVLVALAVFAGWEALR